MNIQIFGTKKCKLYRWVSQEQFRIRIVEALMMKVGWMISVHKIEMMKNRRRFQCHLR